LTLVAQCPQGSTSPSPAGSECPIGGYCSSPTTYTACSAGTYGIKIAGTSQSDACVSCDAGYYCPNGGIVSNTRALCPAGAYCPAGASSPTLCPAGYESSLTGQTSLATCRVCDRGTYCLTQGTISGTTCPTGYYCPAGTLSYTSFPCPAGTFSGTTGLYTSAQCKNCTLGHYCAAGSSAPVACHIGYYNPFGGGPSNTSCIACEAGYACPYTGNLQCLCIVIFADKSSPRNVFHDCKLRSRALLPVGHHVRDTVPLRFGNLFRCNRFSEVELVQSVPREILMFGWRDLRYTARLSSRVLLPDRHGLRQRNEVSPRYLLQSDAA